MITYQFFDKYKDQDVYVYLLSDKIDVLVCTLGATVMSVSVPSASGKKADVVLSMTSPEEMVEKGDYMGAIVGRCANRIANGCFTLNDTTYKLALNDGGKAHLHGGNVGFNRKLFKATIDGDSLLMELDSPDGDEGYPGNLKMAVRYTVKGSSLAIEYYGESDKDTVFNPTSHIYFNLNGESDGSILDNFIQINADNYLETDENLIPTVKRPVKDTPFDFTVAKAIGQDINAVNEQLTLAGGYDHNFCLDDNHAATAYSTKTGVCMDVFTDCCGMQFYTGNFLKGQEGRSVYGKHSGFCLETQFYPNAINNPEFASPVLKKGEKHHSRTQYVFSLL
ncbi:MAG: galactose mutarotase [Corallococcus sp.]|nr:galactose mutarotase [Bacillota bacterium]MCM1533064.1 galactose mutarotase [Corallococcus sp.]